MSERPPSAHDRKMMRHCGYLLGRMMLEDGVPDWAMESMMEVRLRQVDARYDRSPEEAEVIRAEYFKGLASCMARHPDA